MGRGAVEFFPIVYPSTAIGKRMSDDPAHWHAWEFSLRALTSATSEEIASNTRRLLAAPCTCFDRVEANTLAFNPLARAAKPRLNAFRAAALQNVQRLLHRASNQRAHLRRLPRRPHAHTMASGDGLEGGGQSVGGDMLWIARNHARRNIANADRLAEELLQNKRIQVHASVSFGAAVRLCGSVCSCMAVC